MNFSLIVCTYQRPQAIIKLLESVQKQVLYPNEIIIVDGSKDEATQNVLRTSEFLNVTYFKVKNRDRGLTKQRNFGISKVSENIEVVCFLDDDTELKKDYFKEIIKTYQFNKDVIGVGGVSVNENRWQKKQRSKTYNKFKYYQLDGYVVKEGLRNVLRNYLGLQSNLLPGKMPNFSHGRTNGYPLNNKIYEVDLLIGMSFSFRKSVFEYIKFSHYFEGYGLYEDADFCIRALKYGKNVINTAAKLDHYHDESGRPNKYKYGKMVVINGWYVWRTKYPNPSLKARFKWNVIILLLMMIRFVNIFTTKNRKEAFTEALGRIIGLVSLIFNKPLVQR
ncbi:glycosyltransferase family 2 protein [Bacteroidota bacterium]